MNKITRNAAATAPDPRVEAYLANQLDESALRRFELELIGSTELQAQVRDAYVLQELLRDAGPAGLSVAEPRRSAAGWAMALAAGLGAVAVGLPSAWWVQQSGQVQSALAEQHADLQRRYDRLAGVQLGLPSLRLGVSRSLPDESLPILRQSPDHLWVRVVVPASVNVESELKVSLLDPAGQLLWQGEDRGERIGGGEYALLLPLGGLQPGRHELLFQSGAGEYTRYGFEVAGSESAID